MPPTLESNLMRLNTTVEEGGWEGEDEEGDGGNYKAI